MSSAICFNMDSQKFCRLVMGQRSIKTSTCLVLESIRKGMNTVDLLTD